MIDKKETREVVVVTGGNGLIGGNFLSAIAASGRIAVGCDLQEISYKDREIPAGRGEIASVMMNIVEPASVNAAIAEIHDRYGRIDALVNAAYPRNSSFGDDFFDVDYHNFCDNVNLQLGGYFLTSQKFSKYFVEQGNGVLVNLASIYGCVAPRFELYEGTAMGMPVEYPLVKSAIIQLTQYLAVTLKGTGVRANCISPGGILDGQDQRFLERYKGSCSSKGMLNPEDLNSTLLYLLAKESRYVNGQNIIVDDGFVL